MRQNSETARRHRTVTRPLAIAGLTVALVAGVAAPAGAAGPLYVRWDGPSELTVEYGEPWSLAIAHLGYVNSGRFLYDDGRVWVAGLPTSGNWTFYTGSYEGRAPLAVGTHRFTGEVMEYTGVLSTTDETATIVVEPAALGMDVQAIADPSSEGGLIISARLSGRFIDSLIPAEFRSPADPAFPAGIWDLSVRDAADAVVFTSSQPGAVDGPAGASAYWADAAPDTDYTATATFTPDAASSGNFAIAGGRFDFSTPAGESASPSPGSDDSPPPVETETDGVPVPLVWIIAFGVVVLGVLLAAVLVLLRGRPRSDRAAAGDAATAPHGPGARSDQTQESIDA